MKENYEEKLKRKREELAKAEKELSLRSRLKEASDIKKRALDELKKIRSTKKTKK